MTKAGIKIENVHLSFGQTEVLKGVNLDIKPGEFFAFLARRGRESLRCFARLQALDRIPRAAS